LLTKVCSISFLIKGAIAPWENLFMGTLNKDSNLGVRGILDSNSGELISG